MEKIEISDCLTLLHPLGRTLYHPEGKTLFFNWTCSGLELWFKGSCLIAEFTAMPGAEMDVDPITGRSEPRVTWPWAAVVMDNEETLTRRFEVNRNNHTELVFTSDSEELHCIKIIKLTENDKGYLGIKGFRMDGALQPMPPDAHKKKLQVIGDSISCGFGNAVNDRNRAFYAADENGWMSYGAIAARLLDMEPAILSSSGICITAFTGWPHPYAMNGLYPYTDRMLESKLGKTEYTPWDFTANPVDTVVLNLGTNDANGIMMMGERDGEKMHRRDYIAFIRMLRQVHGPEARIVCALGSMDYCLYSTIEKLVAEYRGETRDDAVYCFRFQKMNIADPVGACGHPHIVTHLKMANELAAFIRNL